MHSRARSVLTGFLGLTVLFLMSATPAQSQDPTPSPNPAIYKNQLQEAVTLGRRTLKAIEALPNDDSIPIEPKVLNEARSTYALIRAARHGMELQKERAKFPDVVLEQAFKRVDQAWNLARVPIDYRGLPRHQYIPRASGDLKQALRLIDQALMILP